MNYSLRCPSLLFFILLIHSHFAFAKPDNKSEEQSSPSEECILSFGLTDWPPMQYIQADGTIVGFHIELLRDILKEMKCELAFIPMVTWQQMIDSVRTGAVDFISNASPTKARKKYAFFSRPYHQDVYSIYIRSEDKNKFNAHSISELKSMKFRLALATGFFYDDKITEWENDPEYKHLLSYTDKTTDNFAKLLNNEADGFLEDPFITSYELRSRNLTNRFVPLTIQSLGLKSSFMFSKKTVSKKTFERFDKALKEIQLNLEYRNMWLDPKFRE